METPHEGLYALTQDLEQLLQQNENITQAIAATFKLPPVLAHILGLLLSMPLVTPEVMAARVDVITESKVGIHRLRKYMQQHGIVIQSRRRVGYWIDNPTKDRIARIVIAHITPSGSQMEAARLANALANGLANPENGRS